MRIPVPLVILGVLTAALACAVVFRETHRRTPTTITVEDRVGAPHRVTISKPPTGPDATEVAALRAIAARYSDAVALAASTPRIGLAPIVRDLQNLARETEEMKLHGCVSDARGYLVKAERGTVQTFLAFMQQQPSSYVTSLTDGAAVDARNYRMSLDTCVAP